MTYVNYLLDICQFTKYCQFVKITVLLAYNKDCVIQYNIIKIIVISHYLVIVIVTERHIIQE
jgi:hypothetical protein